MKVAFAQWPWILLLLCLIPFHAATANDDHAALYRAVTIVTGTVEPERSRGFAACLREVLMKISGDPALADAPGVDALADRVGDFVAAFGYRDRMASIPVHDEQGTRERPHFLTVEFSQPKIDAALRSLGAKPWLDRPLLTLNVTIDNGARRFPLLRDGAFGRDQRASLLETAERYGLPIFFPLAQGRSAKEPVLTGTLIWQADRLEWSAEWSLGPAGDAVEWAFAAPSFDGVFRQALGRAMTRLAAGSRP
ncbi:DUF2066 domain-containing protein [Nitratireductor pacificus]|uniref:DUF2066 domain-containing protein n=1 Tax=Nitratireductor pacificus pht-3B TaxID=391937 RepID=K2N3W1_9HYPH|nr:DUF2066 domain-containing protein [Nitratireductor pacificus]EKF18958.1 hypothetical protein NA2_10798 [Nitratireductor pacificus pht-3B]